MEQRNHVAVLRQHTPDVEILAEELDVQGRAAKAALSLTRERDCSEMDDAQQGIRMHCLQRLREAKGKAEAILDRERYARAEYAAFNPLGRLKDTMHKFESAVQHATFGRRNELRNSFGKVVELRMQLWKLRQDRGYERDPQPQGNVQAAVGWLVVAVILETFFNGVLFAGGSEMGYVGGLTQALFISLVNLILSFGTGYLLKLRNALNGWRRYAVTGGLLSMQQAIIGLVNLSAAHYRSAVAVLESFERANRQFLSRVFTQPFQLESFESFVLLIFGIIIAQYLLYKGYTFGDVDKEFGKVGRELAEAEKDYEELKLNVEEDIKLARADADREVGRDVGDYSRILGLYKSSLAMSRNIREEYGRIASEWNDAQKLLLRQFRRLLGGAPTACPLPGYWDTYKDFAEGEMQVTLDLTDDEAVLARMVVLDDVVSKGEEIKQIVHQRELEESRSLEAFFNSIERKREKGEDGASKNAAGEPGEDSAGPTGPGSRFDAENGSDAGDSSSAEYDDASSFSSDNGNGPHDDMGDYHGQAERI
ncbi:hypothetical protein N1030_00555 [Desulfovibrio mangrovi]|uniref:hypothetical protein n=1 Tax=Desulfovibrio mangrovi TaxID=2976983 RepID=UPI0022461B06|nr:hypothetical protein [Desulfovibrio mangrovi]UZP67491.1 hypothetical protein N1030_00555 [Desulfovibrio mangrovi]